MKKITNRYDFPLHDTRLGGTEKLFGKPNKRSGDAKNGKSPKESEGEVLIMNMANGFLATMYAIEALPSSLFGEFRSEGDIRETAAGELLTVSPTACSGKCGDCAGRRSFLGLDTHGKTTIGRVVEVSGRDLIDRFLDSDLVSQNDPGFTEEEWMHHLLTLSGKLCACREAGFVRIVRRGAEYEIYPVNANVPVRAEESSRR